jgi:hypothetical protein
MRTYDELTEAEKTKAAEKATDRLLGLIVEGAVRFNDELNGDGLQARIDAAMVEANDMQTPWFAGEYVMEAAGEEIKSMARMDAEDALYPAPDERVIRL